MSKGGFTCHNNFHSAVETSVQSFNLEVSQKEEHFLLPSATASAGKKDPQLLERPCQRHQEDHRQFSFQFSEGS